MKKTIFFILLITLLSCGKIGKSYDKMDNTIKGKNIAYNETRKEEIKSPEPEELQNDKESKKDTSKTNEQSTKNKENITRKIIKEGYIKYNVPDIKGVEKNVIEKVKLYEGYVASSNFGEEYGSMVIKIPENRFDQFLQYTDNFGKIISKSISARDVTEQYFDLEGRIKNKRIHQERLRKYLNTSNSIDDLLKVESELNRITTELESMEGSFKELSHLISYSTLTLEFSLPYKTKSTLPKLKKDLKNLGTFIVNFLYYIVLIFIYFVIIAIPILIIIALLYYITFGKLGLLKKIFQILSKKEDKGKKN